MAKRWPKKKTFDTGKLPLRVQTIPTWICDPNHRKKITKKRLYAADCKANKVDILRLSKYYGYFLRKNKYLTDFEEYKKRAKAPLEHLFNYHDYCSE